jgi:enoyl-CoA hydratase/carnithine racemase
MPNTLLLSKENHILTITLNQPKLLNAFTGQQIEELIAVFVEAEMDADILCILVTGNMP